MKKPIAILLCGIGGTGKSTTADNLENLLKSREYNVKLIRFDEFRKSLAPQGVDPFTRDVRTKQIIYERAGIDFSRYLNEGYSLVIDSGLSKESIRKQLIESMENLRVVHIYCPLVVAIYRDTVRSLSGNHHERGSFLHLHALADLVNPFKKEKFDQPGITYPFEYPTCVHAHVNTFWKKPARVAEEIVKKLGIQ